MNKEIQTYHNALAAADAAICNILYEEICKALPKAVYKIWHRHPVWFIDDNPIVGYSKLKDSIQLLFWSGQSFDEPALLPKGRFKAAESCYKTVTDLDTKSLKRWLKKAVIIQWDYKNLIKRKGVLERLL